MCVGLIVERKCDEFSVNLTNENVTLLHMCGKSSKREREMEMRIHHISLGVFFVSVASKLRGKRKGLKLRETGRQREREKLMNIIIGTS